MTSVTDVNNETEKSPATGGLPLRGFAMVLIAVAVLLGLWALYSLTQGGNDDSTDTAAETSVSDAPAEPAQSPAPGPADPPTQPEEQAPGAEDRERAEATDRAEGAEDAPDEEGRAPDGRTDDEQPAEGTPAGSGGTGGAAPAEPARLNVLNNSTVPNLAADVSERLREEGYELGEVGNLAEDIFPETTVFFTEGNAEAEAEARELASRLNGVARENVDSLPPEATGANDITLVLIGDVAL